MRKLIPWLLISLTTISKTNIGFADDHSNTINPLAPVETAQYAPLLGQWSITDESIDKQGNWQAGPGADWNWYTILDGHAIQDDWIQPALNKDVPVGKRQYGTNIRTYNPKKKQWDQIWTSSSGHKFDTFTAIGDGEKIVMRGFYAGYETRVTFYNLKPNSFDWKMEQQSKTDPSQWKEVYRIHGKRKK